MGHPQSLGGEDVDGVFPPLAALGIVVEGVQPIHLKSGGVAGERYGLPGPVVPVFMAAQHQVGRQRQGAQTGHRPVLIGV